MSLMRELYLQLSALGLQVTRGWPQALVGLPSIALTLSEDRVEKDGSQYQAIDLVLRAATPEQADSLAQQVDEALPWRRSACKDAAEKDGSCYHKVMRYERRLGGEAEATATLSLGAATYTAVVLEEAAKAETQDVSRLSDSQRRLRPVRKEGARICLLLPVTTLAAIRAALGGAAQVDSRPALLLGYTLKDGRLAATLTIQEGT